MPYFCLKAGFSLNFGLNPISSVRTEKTKDSIDLLVSLAGEEASLHDDWLLAEGTLAQEPEQRRVGKIINYQRKLRGIVA